jgi:hypothetical protein
MQALQEEYLEEQPLSPEDKELLELIYDRLDIFEEMNRPYHDAAKEARKIIHMNDPKQDDPEMVRRAGKKTLQMQTNHNSYQQPHHNATSMWPQH